jgi:SNF2 family DNA or RNA helicase
MYRPLPSHACLRVLIVAPSSALGSWDDELRLENQRLVHLGGKDTITRKQELFTSITRARGNKPLWVLINKEAFLWLPEIAKMDWDVVILDESTFIKSVKAKVTKFFLENFRDVPHRWILTGMPNPESEMEFWPQMAFLHGSFMKCGAFHNFKFRYFDPPDETNDDYHPKPGALDDILAAVSDRASILRWQDIGVQVPRTEETRHVEFDDETQEIYEQIEKEWAFGDDETDFAVTQYTWLRQLCGGCHDGKMLWRGKLDALIELLTGELAKEPVVVWFNYNPELHAAINECHSRKISATAIWGGIHVRERERRVREWDAGQHRVLLAQQAVASMGTKLSHSDTAIYYSEPVGHLASEQTRDRILTMEKSGVLIIHLLVKKTIDEDVRRLLCEKSLQTNTQLERAVRLATKARLQKEGSHDALANQTMAAQLPLRP